MTSPQWDPATGEIVSDDVEPRQRPNLRVVEDPEKVRLKAEIEVLEGQVKDLERDCRDKRAAMRRLRDAKEAERRSYVRREEVELWLDVWKLATGHPNSKLTATRFDAIRKAIELGYTVEQWATACEFVGARPFVRRYERYATGTEKERQDDADLVARKLEKFARLGWEMKRQAKEGQ